jgi:D-3-phosphoglycerate dehydrogenase
MTLAERLGTFLAQVPRGSIDSIQITYHGRLAETKTELIRNCAIAGVLGHLEQVNRINAASVAAERGIRLHEEKKEAPFAAAGSLLQLSLHTSETSISASGAILHGDSPRLLHLDGIDIEAPLQGTLLTIRNRDVPGVIGRVGTILGEHNINIANFALGRSDGRDAAPASAIAVVQIDGEVTDAVLRELRAVPAITGVRLVTL